VQADDDVHIVLLDGVKRNLAEIVLLVSTVELGTRNFDPGSISSGNAEGVDVLFGHLVDVGSGW